MDAIDSGNEMNAKACEHNAASPANHFGHALMKAALGLPLALPLALPLGLGVTVQARADSAPDKALVSFKYLDYLDSQPGFDRIRVKAPSVLIVKPLSSEWSVSSTYTADAISGASPAFHTQALKTMHDERHALDVSATRYLSLGTRTFGGSYSKEADYLSRGLFYAMTESDESKNSTWTAGVSISSDQINPTNHVVMNETKQSYAVIMGLTQVFNMNHIAQFQLGHYSGKGDYSDPYKVFDNRPRERVNNTFTARWNHYMPNSESTLKMGYRYYEDDWGIRAHTWERLDALAVLASLHPNGGRFFHQCRHLGLPISPFPHARFDLLFRRPAHVGLWGAHLWLEGEQVFGCRHLGGPQNRTVPTTGQLEIVGFRQHGHGCVFSEKYSSGIESLFLISPTIKDHQ